MIDYGAPSLRKGWRTSQIPNHLTSFILTTITFSCFPGSYSIDIVPQYAWSSFSRHVDNLTPALRRFAFRRLSSYQLKSPRVTQAVPLQLLSLLGIKTTGLQFRIGWASYKRSTLKKSASDSKATIAETLEFLSNLPFAKHVPVVNGRGLVMVSVKVVRKTRG